MVRYISLLLFISLAFWSCEEEPEPIPEDCAGVPGGNNICGCTDSIAINFNSDATYDDESCEYDTTPPTISNLTLDWLYCNYLDVCTQPLLWLDFSASAYDYGSGVDYVEAWIGYESLGKDYYSPYSWDWSPFYLTESKGNKTFKVKAYDEAGNYRRASDRYNVIYDVTRPTILEITASENPTTATKNCIGHTFYLL